jgi:hypothetical protein
MEFTLNTDVFPRENFSFPGPKSGLVTSAQRVPAQTKKKKKLGQFSGSKPEGLSPQRALLNLGRPWTSPKGPFGTECGNLLPHSRPVNYRKEKI